MPTRTRGFFPKTIAEGYSPADLDNEGNYVNGAKLSPSVALPPRQRAQWEGQIQRGSLLNATTDVWLGDELPTPEQLAQLVADLRTDGLATGLMVSPEFTLCRSCGHVAVGSHGNCPSCGSNHVETLAKSTNRYSRVSGWSPAAQAERRQRARLTPADL